VALPIYGRVDVAVIGAGPAGVAAALAAARNGAQTLLVSEQFYLGGTLVCGLPWLGFIGRGGEQIVRGIPDEITNRLVERGASTGYVIGDTVLHGMTVIDPPRTRLLLAEMMVEAGVRVAYGCRGIDAVTERDKIAGVVLSTKSGLQVLQAKVVVDATGDGDVAAAAGAEYSVGREEDHLQQAATLVFILDGVDQEPLKDYIRSYPSEMRTPTYCLDHKGYAVIGLWDLTRKAREAGEYSLPHTRVLINTMPVPTQMTVNTTRVDNPDSLHTETLSENLTELQRQITVLLNFFRKYVPGFEGAYISSITDLLGVRESRRIRGEHVLTTEEIVAGSSFPDGIARGGHDIDLHYPGLLDRFPGRHDPVPPYDIPYGCLVPLGVDQLLVAGRCLSATHEALGSVRVMATCMALGQAAGTAAALAVKSGVSPRELDVNRLVATLREQGAELGK